MLSFVTGPSKSGKTTRLLQLVEQLQAEGVSVAGVISPAVFENGQKTGIDVLLLPTRKQLPLARPSTKEESQWKIKRSFDPQVVRAVNEHFDSLQAELLIIDELGPVEFSDRGGFVSAMRILDEGAYKDAIVVIRPSLLDEATKRWSPDRIMDLGTQGDGGFVSVPKQ